MFRSTKNFIFETITRWASQPKQQTHTQVPQVPPSIHGNIYELDDYAYDVPKTRYQRNVDEQSNMEYRNEWLANRMKKFYTQEELEQVLTNRRSDGSDQGVINHFFKADQPYHPIPLDENTDAAISWVTESFRPNRRLHPVSFPDIRYYPFTLNVSSEAPWTNSNFTFKPVDRNVDEESELPKLPLYEDEIANTSNVTPLTYMKERQRQGLATDARLSFHNLYNQIFVYNRWMVHLIGIGAKQFWKGLTPLTYYWLTLHMRTHVVAAHEPDKVRAVFGAPKLLLMVELMFIWSMQATYLNTEAGRMLWGREIIRGGWRKLFSECYENGPPNTIISADWSQFDNRLLHQLISIVHRIWRSYFDFSKYEPTSFYPNAKPANSSKIERLWKWMCYSILNTPILLPNGKLYRWKWNGFGSGFQQTQLMDSFCNAIMLTTCLSALGVNLNSDRFWARFIGDDSIAAFCERMFEIYGPDFLSKLADAAKYYFNAKLSPDKTSFSNKLTNVSVLSYFNQYGLPYRTDEDLLRHLYFPERFQDFGRLAAAALGMAYANCGHSVRFHALCEYIFNKLVHERGIDPDWTALQWMVRSGIFPILDDLRTTEFPRIHDIQAMVFAHSERTTAQKQRQWPTRQHPKNRFYFILDV
jgi:hypothetical protein